MSLDTVRTRCEKVEPIVWKNSKSSSKKGGEKETIAKVEDERMLRQKLPLSFQWMSI